MAEVITRLRVESQEYDSKIKRATQSLNEMTAQAQKQGHAIATANKENIALAQSLGKMQTVATSAKGKMAELSNAFTDATHAYNRLTQAEKASPFGRALKQSVDQLQTRVRSLRTEMATTQRQLGKGGAGMGGGIGSSLAGGLSAGMSMLGPYAMAAAGVTAAVSGMKKVIGDVVSINMQFEQSSANLAAVMGTTRDKVGALTTQAKQLGATTQYTAVQITELQTNLARLGFTQQEILNSTKSVQALATATGADLGEAANLAGAALRSFGLDSGEMERVASVLAVSTTKSALSFEKLATAVPIVSPVAKQFGFEIEDVVTLLGKLSDAGFDASSAATASRNIFLNMANSSGKLAQALGRPIKSIEDLAPALVELKNKGIDLAEMLSLTDKRSVAAFATFVDSAGTMVDFKNSITDCSDALDGMVNEQLNTLQGSVTIMKSAWEGLMLTFSSSNGLLKELADGFTRLLGAYTEWRKRNHGGDEAISTYESGVTDDVKKRLDDQIAAQRAKGVSDESLVRGSEKKKAAYEKERDAMRALLAEWEKAGKQGWGSKAVQDLMPQVQAKFGNMDGAAYKWAEQMQKAVARKNDQIAQHDYIIGALTPAASTGTMGGAEGGAEGGAAVGGNRLQVLKAQYEEQEKLQIASLDRMAMSEADYEAKVYQIKRETLQKIADLYQEETAEKARANAAIAQLDIQYQGTQMRLANKGRGGSSGPKEEEGISGYGTKALEERRKQATEALSKEDMGSQGYIIAAQNLVDLDSFTNLLKTATANGISLDESMLEGLLTDIDLGVNVSDETWTELASYINGKLSELGIEPIELDVKTGNVKSLNKEVSGTIDHVQGAATAFQALGDAMSQIEDPGAQVAGLIAQAIGSVVAGYGTATAQAATMGPWAWIAFAATGLATLITTIAGIKSATAGTYANGGIIPGNNLSGDNLTASVNSGELILNRAQQSNIADQLTQGGLNNLHLETSISGETIRVALANSNRRRGGSRGEYAIGK